jgi:hypothetical protein
MDSVAVVRRLAFVVIACAFVPAGGAIAAQPDTQVAFKPADSSRPLVALRGRPGVRAGKNALALVRVSPSTLRVQAGRRVLLGDRASAWSYSPDGSRLVLADSTLFGWLRFVDVTRMRALGDLRLNAGGFVRATAWLGPDRLVAVASYEQETTLVLVDPVRRRVLASQELQGSFEELARSGDTAAVLLSPWRGIGPATLAVVDRSGTVRTADVGRIRVGTDPFERERIDVIRSAHAGLAVDPASGRAFVVGAASPLAEIDLASLAVRYHDLARPVSLLGRLRDWIEPSAEAKGAPDGPSRSARWLGDGRLAVWGYDNHGSVSGNDIRWSQTPVGLSVVDTRDWSVRTIDPTASEAAPAGSGLLAWSSLWNSDARKLSGTGLSLYDLAGNRRFHVFGERSVPYAVPVGARALVAFLTSTASFAVVDLQTGRVLRTEKRVAPPFILVD